MLLYQILTFTKSYKNNKFEISDPMQNEKF